MGLKKEDYVSKFTAISDFGGNELIGE